MNDKARALQERTHNFFVQVLRFCETLPDRIPIQRIQVQLIDAAGSTDSNYQAACRARSTAEFIAKVGVAAEEADETKGWLAALQAISAGGEDKIKELIKEADELTAIFVASQKTAKRRLENKRTLERAETQQRRTAR